jgi:predicted nicotinamide N-methyase
MELGCGHGLPGVQALLDGADEVYFLDLNHEVLASATAPNVSLNCDRETAAKARYFGGDWLNVSDLLAQDLSRSNADNISDEADQCSFVKASLILSSETVYTEQVADQLCELLYRHVAYPDGEALIAAKRFYFGCGGGTEYFKCALQTNDKTRKLTGETVWVAEDGKSNTREIVRVVWQEPGA